MDWAVIAAMVAAFAALSQAILQTVPFLKRLNRYDFEMTDNS